MISVNGVDSVNCGQSVPCHSVGFALTSRAASNDIIKIMNNNLSEPFMINRSFPIPRNITIAGINGRPIINASSPFQPKYLFEESELPKMKLITLRMENLYFRGIGIASLTNITSDNIISFQNCYFENVVTTKDMINVVGHQHKHDFGQVNFLNSNLVNNVALGNSRAVSVEQIRSIFYKCHFRNNLSSASGLIYLAGGCSRIKNSYFERNSILKPFTMGGAVFAFSTVEILNCSFKFNGNEGTFAGGAIGTVGRKLMIKSSIFEYNTAHFGGALYLRVTSVTEISRSVFKGNKAKRFGGAIFNYKAELCIKKTSFDDNTVSYSSGRGGAIFTTGKKLAIESSLFEFNTALGKHGDGGAISLPVSSVTDISGSFFIRNQAKINGGAISCSNAEKYRKTFPSKNSTAVLYIFNCSFQRNIAKGGAGVAIFEGMNLTVKASSFDRNNASVGGGAIYTLSILKGIISRCSFRGNEGNLYGGALSHNGKILIIKNSTFQNNTLTGYKGQGGALFAKDYVWKNYGQVFICHCAFDGNRAAFRGGAIRADHNRLIVRNSSFRSSSYPKSQAYFGGDVLYSRSAVTFEHVCLLDVDRYTPQNSLIVHEHFLMALGNYDGKYGPLDVDFKLSLKVGVHIKCLTGKNIAISNHTLISTKPYYPFLSVSCSVCPRNFYSLSSGHLDVSSQNQSFRKTDVKCHPCPLGGVCEKGRIRAAENFWGYTSGKEVHFTSCPFGYCCAKKECVHYSSCHKARTGSLCGQCEKGFTENILTSDCLTYKQCQHPWYWVIVALSGMLYLIAFMYLNEITKNLKTLLIPIFIAEHFKDRPFKLSVIFKGMLLCIKSKFKNEFSENCQVQYITDDVFLPEAGHVEPCQEMQGNIELAPDEEIQSITAVHQESEESIFPGLLKIIIFFYQTNVLFKVYTGSKSHGFVHILQEAMSSVFSLRSDGAFTQSLSWCPLDNIQPVSKVLLKSSFIVYLFFLVFLVFVLCKAGKQLKIDAIQLNNSRLVCCMLRLIFISYAGITVTCFSLLSCVQLGPLGRVLFIDGSILCYRWWQMIVIVMMCCWIIPFPVTIYASSQLLHNNILSTKKFLLCLLFPLPAICYWLYICCKNARKESEDITVLDEGVEEVLQIVEGPFRTLNISKKEKNYRLPWESVLIGRRLVLIFLKTFIVNTFLRLSLMLFCTILFMIHHIYTKPFSSSLLNNIETVSLSMLNIVCFLNIVPAYDYAYPTYLFVHAQGVLQVLNVIETALNLLFPSIFGLVVAILISIRIFQFIFWLCRCFVRLVRLIPLCTRCNKLPQGNTVICSDEQP